MNIRMIPDISISLRYFFISFFIFGIHANSDGTVVEQFHLHVSTELSSAYGFADRCTEFRAELVIEGDGMLVASSLKPAGTVTFLVAGEEGELTDH